MEPLPQRRFWLPSPGHLIALAVILILGAISIPAFRSSNRASNERHASTSLKTLTSAEADFRLNDRDGNHVEDFWTGDVSGLYHVISPKTKAAVQLIDESVADADSKPLYPPTQGTREDAGYYFQALESDDSVEGDKGSYKLDTDKSGRKVHNQERFGFSAFPSSPGNGKYLFVVNENNTIFRWKFLQPRTTWPDDQELKKHSCEED